jgi:hypothetical protein
MTTYNTNPYYPVYSRIDAGGLRTSLSSSESSENKLVSSSAMATTPASIGTCTVIPSSQPSKPIRPNLQYDALVLIDEGERGCSPGDDERRADEALPRDRCCCATEDVPGHREGDGETQADGDHYSS